MGNPPLKDNYPSYITTIASISDTYYDIHYKQFVVAACMAGAATA